MISKCVYEQTSIYSHHASLAQTSLVEGNEGFSGYDMHPVVHEWAWQMQDQATRSESQWMAVLIVGAALPTDGENYFMSTCRRFLSQTDRCTKFSSENVESSYHVKGHLQRDRAFLWSLYKIGFLFSDLGNMRQGAGVLRQSFNGYMRVFGANDPMTLSVVLKLSDLYRELGKLNDAVSLLQQALQQKEKIAALESTLVIETMIHLGFFYRLQGRLNEAEEMCLGALQRSQNELSSEHELTNRAFVLLAIICQTQRKYEEAQDLYQRALQGYERTMGKENTPTLDAAYNLGHVYGVQGKLDEAEKIGQRVFQVRRKRFGPEHIDTLTAVSFLGNIQLGRSHPGTAEELYQQALRGWEKALGGDLVGNYAPAVNTYNNLGIAFERQGRLEEARMMFERALEGYRIIYGVDNEEYRRTRRNLDCLDREESTRREAVQTEEEPEDALVPAEVKKRSTKLPRRAFRKLG